MIEQGLVDEVNKLISLGFDWDNEAMTGHGYRELRPYLEGKVTLGEAIEEIKKDTRHYAKRQMTWWRRDARIHWIRKAKEAERLVDDWLKET